MLIHFFKGNITHLTPGNMSSYISYGENLGFNKQLFLISNRLRNLSPKDIEMYKSLFLPSDKSCHYKIWTSSFEIFKIVLKIQKDDRIIFHSMLNPVFLRFLVYFILLCRGFLNNVVLVCWNLSDAIIQSDRFYIRIYNYINLLFIKRFRRICLISETDKKIFEDNFKTNNATLLPLLNVGVRLTYHKYRKVEVGQPLRIMVSHSGWQHNNHIESFRLLERFRLNNIEVLCPLCYGDKDYINKIISEGEKIFGDKFKYFTELMPYDDYVNYLNKYVAIYVTSANIQTGLGAANILLRSGAKIFVGNNLYDSYQSMGVTVEKVNVLKNIPFDVLSAPLDDQLYNQNIEALLKFYDSDRILEEYKLILN